MADKVTDIVECRPLMTGLTVCVKVLDSAIVSESAKRKVVECLVADKTASILFKARGKECEDMSSGRSLKISPCSVDMFHGSMRLVCDGQTTFEAVDAIDAKTSPNMSFLEFESVIVGSHAAAARSAHVSPEKAVAQEQESAAGRAAALEEEPAFDAGAFPEIGEATAA